MLPSPSATFRDPVHGYIDVLPHEKDIIDTPAFQRLRSIRQLGLTSYVYHGAEHSRFGHSLGVMHLAGRFAERLVHGNKSLVIDALGWTEPDFERNAERLVLEARLGGLLHDIGHAPFSHVGEEQLFPPGRRHEDYSAAIIVAPDLGIGDIIDSQLEDWAVTKESVAALAGGSVHEAGFLGELISGPLDVDKMDYLLRDSLFCGVEYGKYDIGRIMDTLVLYDEEVDGNLRLGLDGGGLHSVEGFILARYFMFNQVYLHAVRRSFDHILTEFIQEYLAYTFGTNRYPEDLEKFLQLNDDALMAAAHRDADNRSRNAAWRLVSRRHLKVVYESETHPDPLVANRALIQLPSAIQGQFRDIAVWSDRASFNPDTFSGSPFPVRTGNSWRSLGARSTVLQNLREVNKIRVYADVRGDTSLETEIAAFCTQRLG